MVVGWDAGGAEKGPRLCLPALRTDYPKLWSHRGIDAAPNMLLLGESFVWLGRGNEGQIVENRIHYQRHVH